MKYQLLFLAYVFQIIFAVITFGQTTTKNTNAPQDSLNISDKNNLHDTIWSIKRCIDYALAHNISVKQADIQARLSKVSYQQAFMSRFPNVSLSTGLSFFFGRAINPTTNTYLTQTNYGQSWGVSSGVNLFGGLKVNNTITQAKTSYLSTLQQSKKANDDVSLNILSAYIQCLSLAEQIDLSKIQIDLAKSNLAITQAKIDVGSIPEINLYQIQAELANDSLSLISNIQSYELSLIALKVLLNLDLNMPFGVDKKSVAELNLLPISELQPEVLYALAKASLPGIKAAEYTITSNKLGIKIAKAAFYPSVSVSLSGGTSFNSVLLSQSSGGFKYFNQLANNLNGSLGGSVSIPIFNNLQAWTSVASAKYNLVNAEVGLEQSLQQLKNDIYTNYNNTVSALEKSINAERSAILAQKVSDISNKQYAAGAISAFELITNENKLLQANVQHISNKYEYILRMKILEYYRGQGIKL